MSGQACLGNRAWQGIVILLLTVMISLNLRILVNVQYDDSLPEDNPVKDSECRGILKYVGSARVNAFNATQAMYQWTSYKPSQARVLGHHRSKRGFLTIGVPSIKRQNGMTYLRQTLRSLIDKTTTHEKTDVVVLVFLADFDTDYNTRVTKDILDNFMEYINMGFIQVVQASHDFYPKLTQLKRNFNDKPDRVTWRSKQVSDFAFMFLHSKNISDYYIQLEDDVVCAPGFIPAIRDYIKRRSTRWAVLEFSELGFIGKLFKSSDLVKLAQFMMTFYDEQPIDWLIRYYRMAMAQNKIFLRKPTLFQHIGSTSSFDTSKANKLKDRFFDSGQKKWRGDNPEGVVRSDIQTYQGNGPDLAYTLGNGYFWGVAPKKGQSWTLVFDNHENLTRVVVETATKEHLTDTLHHAVLETSAKFVKMFDNGTVVCEAFQTLGTFSQGRLEVGTLGKTLSKQPIKCLRIRVTEDQSEWAVIDQVAVYVKPTKAT